MLKDFRAFIARGNVLDLAVAVIVGAAFAKITTSLTQDVIMPVIGIILGDFDFSNYFIRLGRIPETFSGNPHSYVELKSAGVAVLGWGHFVTVVLDFFILAFIIFLLVRVSNKIIPRQAAAHVATEVELLTEIRDELRKGR